MKINTLGILGYGSMGKLLEEAALKFISPNAINIYDPNIAGSRPENACAADLVVLCVNDENLEECLSSLAKHFKSESIYVSISAIMTHSQNLIAKYANGKRFLITHPLFGPASFKNNNNQLNDFKIATCNYSLADTDYQAIIAFINSCDLKVVDTTASDHDRSSARDHFLPYLLSHILKDLSVGQSPIRTYSAEQLVYFLECTSYSKTQLKGMYKYNPYVREILCALDICLKDTLAEITK